MIHKIFSIYDKKAEAYMPPFMMQTKGQAMRSFVDLVKDPQSSVNKHPGDFELYEIGEFDDNSCLYTQNLLDVKEESTGNTYKSVNKLLLLTAEQAMEVK